MSNKIEKVKNSSRRQRDENAVKRQVKIAKAHGLDSKINKQVQEPHRLVKHHIMNCGNSKCMLCSNPRKIFKEKTIQEKRFDQDLGEE